MNINIEVLIDSIPYLNTPVSIDTIMRIAGEESEDPINYKKSLIQYMKKKVKKFAVDQDIITINQYTKADLPDLFKYFNLVYKEEELRGDKNRRHLKFIKIRTLYEAWKGNDKKTMTQFERELNKYIANYVGNDNTFIFDGELFIRPYRIKRASMGVEL